MKHFKCIDCCRERYVTDNINLVVCPSCQNLMQISNVIGYESLEDEIWNGEIQRVAGGVR